MTSDKLRKLPCAGKSGRSGRRAGVPGVRGSIAGASTGVGLAGAVGLGVP
jgi:hypothetical protein